MSRPRLAMLLVVFGSLTVPFGCSETDDPGDVGGADAVDTGGSVDVADDSGSADADSSDTGGEVDAGAPTPDSGVDVGDTTDTTDPDTADGGSDGGMDCEPDTDTDSDGLTNCDEVETCTDPYDGDTDGDGLSDFEEYQHGTSPCDPDSDGDGATDGEEVSRGLSPTRPNEDLWPLEACENPTSEPVEYYENATGNWTIALPPPFGNYTELTLAGVSGPVAAAVYDDPATEVAGALVSSESSSPKPDPTDKLRDEIHTELGNVGDVVDGQTGGTFETHDGKDAAVGHYIVDPEQPATVREVREKAVLELAPFTDGEAGGFPTTDGATYRAFQVFVSVIVRTPPGRPAQIVLSIGVAPKDKYETLDKVKFRMDDLTNTTNVAELAHAPRTDCTTYKPTLNQSRAEFYWVLDQSGSMDDYNQKVADFADQFEAHVSNTTLDYRMGVTNMDKENDGHLRLPPAWHTDGVTFSREVEQAVIDCQIGGPWKCSNSVEHGLEAAKRGLTYMSGNAPSAPQPAEALRSDTDVITIFMSDEEANTIIHGSNDYDAALQPYLDFFRDRTTAYAIVGDGGDCGTHDGRAYKDVALETGGKFASLCAPDLTRTIEDIVLTAAGQTSHYVLSRTPISASLRVFVDGEWVPRSRENGFEYFEENNSIAFFGSHRPERGDKNDLNAGDFVAVSYETFRLRCKRSSSKECSKPDK